MLLVIGGCLQEAIVRTVGHSGPTQADGNIIRGPATLSVVCSSAGNVMLDRSNSQTRLHCSIVISLCSHSEAGSLSVTVDTHSLIVLSKQNNLLIIFMLDIRDCFDIP